MCTETLSVTGLHNVLGNPRLASHAMLTPCPEIQVERKVLCNFCLRGQNGTSGHSGSTHLAVLLRGPDSIRNSSNWFLSYSITLFFFQFTKSRIWSCISNSLFCANGTYGRPGIGVPIC